MPKPTRQMTKSPMALARSAVQAAQKALGDYSSPYSKKQFTQPQLFAILVLKAFFRTDYRGIVALLEDFAELRKAIGLKKVPHFTTLIHAEKRLLKKGLLTYSSEAYSEEQGELAFYEAKSGRSSTRRD